MKPERTRRANICYRICFMSTESIVALLIGERDRLNRAIEILGGTGNVVKRRGRPPGKKADASPEASSESTPVEASAPAGRKKRRMSAAARKRISEAQKKRWAAVRK